MRSCTQYLLNNHHNADMDLDVYRQLNDSITSFEGFTQSDLTNNNDNLNVRNNLAIHPLDTPFTILQPIRRPRLLERVYKPIRTPHWCGVLPLRALEIGCK